MKFFEAYFKDTDFNATNNTGEVAVRCPFPHTTINGGTYFESNPSAHINVEKELFHCKVCGATHNEVGFIKVIKGVTYKNAIRLKETLESGVEDVSIWETFKSKLDQDVVRRFNISDAVSQELQLGSKGQPDTFCVPVFVYDELLDVRTYRPNQKPKWLSEPNVPVGLIIPDVKHLKEHKQVLWCAGEKDMLIARTHGFTSFCATGGEQTVPHLFKQDFKDMDVYIIYDNDDAGRSGAVRMASFVTEAGGRAYIVDGHHKICIEKGEDLWDFFCKYHKTSFDLDAILLETPLFSSQDYQEAKQREYPHVSLQQINDGLFPENKTFMTSIQVSATYNGSFSVPEAVEFMKTKEDEKSAMAPGEKRMWYLDEHNIKQLLSLCDNNLREDRILQNLKTFGQIDPKEKFMKVTPLSTTVVYKATVTDVQEFEYSVEVDQRTPIDFTTYSMGCQLETGKSYKIKAKVVAHPVQANHRVLVVMEAEEQTDEIKHFELSEELKEQLKVFQAQDVEEGLNQQYEWAKGFLRPGTPKDIFHTVDMYFNTPNMIEIDDYKTRGFLDVMIVGDTRTNKSSTAQALAKVYGKGNVLSLKTATTQSLIGGTDKSSNVTKLGSIPRNHKGAVILEEFSTADPSFIKTMTEIRSSGVVKIERVQSTIQAPCQVRMLTISNPKPDRNHSTKTVSEYPNGVAILEELVGAREDIARYDFVILVPAKDFENNYEYQSFRRIRTNHPDLELYQNRLRWIWSRKSDQIIFPDETLDQIGESMLRLNRHMDCSVKLLGQELHLKLARMSVAIAGRLCSTEDFETLIVRPEHVKWCEQFLMEIYDNEYFAFRTFAMNERAYNECTPEIIKETETLYTQFAELLELLETCTYTTRGTLRETSGRPSEDFNPVMRNLVKYKLVRLEADKVIPTVRFKKAMRQINRNISDGIYIGGIL